MTETGLLPEPAWLAPALNSGFAYSDRIASRAAGQSVSAFYADCYRHSTPIDWLQRLAAGEIYRNGQQLLADVALAAGDGLVWHRPPWHEAAVPVLPSPLFDNGDLLVFNKPSGLPVLPAGGFLEHTLLAQLQARCPEARPVHRLGRFTSGLLVCARLPASRAWLSALLRESTAQRRCIKTYRALLQHPAPESPLLALQLDQQLSLTTPIGCCPHQRLGRIWAAAPTDASALPASSELRLLEKGERGWLVEVTIATGRPHQIRIHTAAAGAPLLGDPLYGPGGVACDQALPGDGGYHLHAHRLQVVCPDGGLLALEAPLPEALRGADDD
ncbi:MAG: RluA family pseudouridine synthase [Cyanobacteria bacterium]|nr:RluA family pseudouridine synthase [Cyanobacteriota bacterium]MDA1245888.1 RluA family pseudouridine synthase [Cyanobacteriota bacterium]